MIESSKKKIRRIFAPLTVLTSVRCDTPSSPLTQMYDSLGGEGSEYVPDRGLFPTVVVPEVSASAPDGTWPSGNSNARLANVKWFSNGTDIALDPAWTGLYTVHTADDEEKGKLVISRNVGVGEVVQLTMEADLVDFRTMRTIRIATEPVTLSTSVRSGDMYALSLPEGSTVYYSPVDDRLALDDYNRAHDLKSLSQTERAAAAAEKTSYLREIPLVLMRGPKEATDTDDIRFRVDRVSEDGTLTQLGGGFDEIVDIPAPGDPLIMDLRLVEGACYLVRALHGSGDGEREIARTQFQVVRPEVGLTLETHNRASMANTDTKRRDVATVKCGENIVIQPDRLMRFKWLTETASGTEVTHNTGSVGYIDLLRAGVVASDGSGITEDLQIWCEAEMRPPHAFVSLSGKYLKIAGRPVIMN